jgi:hypothetical protein
MKLRPFATAALIVLSAGMTALSHAQNSYFGNSSPNVELATSPSPETSANPPVSLSTNGLKIVAAVWGSGNNFVDVTDRVGEMIIGQPNSDFQVTHVSLKSDPSPGWKKVLITVFELDGARYVLNSREDSRVGVRALKKYVQDKKK